MELKDKIYVREFRDGINQIWDGEKRENTSAIAHHEYIRKDAILEWLQDKVAWFDGTPLAVPYQKVINKIKSL